ncbi:MAG: Na+/H+ antiporter subunit E [Fimbriimonadaceae bacterium]|nr:Na+/H+ antiporter subunit E [Fimbriimonadaceae bacterium]
MAVWNVVLALLWCSFWGIFSPSVFFVGFVLGYLLLWVLARRGLVAARTYTRTVPRVVSLIAVFLYELVLANIRVAIDTLRPGPPVRPAILGIDLDCSTDLEILLLSVLISLTPGTLSMEVSPDRGRLYVHVLHADDDDLDKIKRSIKDSFERRILEVTR